MLNDSEASVASYIFNNFYFKGIVSNYCRTTKFP